MNFKIIENKNKNINYNSFKKDFLNPNIKLKSLLQKYDLNKKEYRRLREKVLKETGLAKKPYKTTLNQSTNIITENTYIRKNKKNQTYFIQKKINGKRKRFGTYKDKKTAIQYRDKLIKNNWEIQ